MKINKFLSGVYSRAKGYAERHSMVKVLSALGAEDTPVGTIISYMGKNPPAHYLACDGAVYNIADYEDLSTFILNEYGSVNYFGGDGTTTFAVPDLRGEFLRGTGTNSHPDQGNGAAVGEHQDGTSMPRIYRNGTNNNLPFYRYFTTTNEDSIVTNTGTIFAALSGETGNYSGSSFTARPTNTSVLYCIKYETTVQVHVHGSIKYIDGEQVIGEWIDGKPIYRKLFFPTANLTMTEKNGNASYSCAGISDVWSSQVAPYYDKIINHYFMGSSTGRWPYRFNAIDGGKFSNIDDPSVKYIGFHINTDHIFVVEYTKK